LDATREFDKTLKQIEKRIEELQALSRSCQLDVASSIQAVLTQLEAVRHSANPDGGHGEPKKSSGSDPKNKRLGKS
jgi:hypothetical protein